ncbi:class I SAM-dependent methyltransferase [Nocardia jejuensis]|uniref:class I SAM-dependent methyltransferase n=1 Tax=Nocardia jejuensis TaxID=328049 RepID=UPI00082F88F9|nr:methyltransferase domain-containing protein [Nocardia jejuensis]
MTRNEQASRTTTPDIGALITWPRRYVLLTDVYFLGRDRTLRRDLAAASGARPGDHVIDIGCGPGRLAFALADRVGPQGRVVGIDPSAPMIDYAVAHAPANCRFELGAAQSLSQLDATFDVVTSTFAMHHIPKSERNTALAAMFRILRPGGHLLLADTHPTGGIRGALIRAMAHRASGHSHRGDDPHGSGTAHGHDHPAETSDGEHFSSVDIRQYRDPLRHNGFTDIEFRTGRFATGILTAVKPG